MKKYWLFSYYRDNAFGGLEDYDGRFESAQDAEKALRAIVHANTAQIVDVESATLIQEYIRSDRELTKIGSTLHPKWKLKEARWLKAVDESSEDPDEWVYGELE